MTEDHLAGGLGRSLAEVWVGRFVDGERTLKARTPGRRGIGLGFAGVEDDGGRADGSGPVPSMQAESLDADVGMVIVAGLWGTWHIVSGFSLAHYWRTRSA